jgi:hypothetical protein
MDCVILETKIEPAVGILSEVDSFFCREIVMKYALAWSGPVCGGFMPRSKSRGYSEIQELSKLLVEISGGKNPRGMQHDLYEKHGLVVGVFEKRAIHIDLCAQKIAEKDYRIVVIDADMTVHISKQCGCIVFCSWRHDLMDRILARSKELKLNHDAYGWPSASEESATATTDGDAASESQRADRQPMPSV